MSLRLKSLVNVTKILIHLEDKKEIGKLKFLCYPIIRRGVDEVTGYLNEKLLRVTKMLSFSSLQCTFLDLNLNGHSDQEPTSLVLQMSNSANPKSESQTQIPGFSKVIKTLPIGHVRYYYKGKNLFEAEKTMDTKQRLHIMDKLVHLTKKYPKDRNPLIYPQNIIVLDGQHVVICPKGVGEKHRPHKVNAAFSCPTPIENNTNVAVKYCLGNILYFLFSGKFPYISSKVNITTEGFFV